jgi:hypothetical protein
VDAKLLTSACQIAGAPGSRDRPKLPTRPTRSLRPYDTADEADSEVYRYLLRQELSAGSFLALERLGGAAGVREVGWCPR